MAAGDGDADTRRNQPQHAVSTPASRPTRCVEATDQEHQPQDDECSALERA